ncbi:hypothetical protein [Tropicimonas aquimaris]|uniref:Uncharacterized protein n=1 Tax=Tropicimonas aquimaris TaxID=914152 RepID=A0ABW3IVL5_9RHOB
MSNKGNTLPAKVTVPISLVVIVLVLIGEAPAGIRGALIGAAFAIPIPSLVNRPINVWIHGFLIAFSMSAGAVIAGFLWGIGGIS